MDSRPSSLARYLLAAYGLLVAYASLHPFSGWRDQGSGLLDFLAAPLLPRYFTAFDLIANVLAYTPLGILMVLALHPKVRGLRAWLLTALAGTLLSLCLEALQSYLPARIPSGLDWTLNATGSALGAAIGLALAHAVVGHGALRNLRHRIFRPGKQIDLGIVLLAGWFLTQLNPETLLFGNGDLRELFQAAPKVLYPAATFVRVEALVSAAHIVTVALLVSLLVVEGGPKRRAFAIVLLGACATRTFAFAVLFEVQGAFAWLTPGALIGLLAGTVAALGALQMPRRLCIALCGMLLMAATALVNLAPDNPYLLNSLQVWPQGHFLNFNGFTRLVSVLWPFGALAYLLFSITRARDASRSERTPG
ncbi:MAG TPA: VanZ family protein [Burkholderiales bacterium]|nr:VanZ family protein [Burkholderiales bacterium]